MGLRELGCIQSDDGCGLLFESIKSAEERCDFGQYVECRDGTDIFKALQQHSISNRSYGWAKADHLFKLAINEWPGWEKPCVRTYVEIKEGATLDTFETQLRNPLLDDVDVTWKFCILGRHDDHAENAFKVNKAFYNKLKIESITKKDDTKLWVLKVKDKYKEKLEQRRFEDVDAFLIGYLRAIERRTNALHNYKDAYKTTELSLNQIRSDTTSSRLPPLPPEMVKKILHCYEPESGINLGVKVAFADLCQAPAAAAEGGG